MNRLKNEKSPYLLQHAQNPVDWYPWCDEAFERAASEDKPVFLSIGYSTCHWCHVMAHESFENQDVADILNQNYIAVKVDREERPDIDGVYMEACLAFNGSGGWPLTAVLTPAGEPFFVGTYFPANSRLGQTGLIELLNHLHRLWGEEKEKAVLAGARMTELLRERQAQENNGQGPGRISGETVLADALGQLELCFDKKYGGFSKAPKFPVPHQLFFLLQAAHYEENDNAFHMAEKTLDAMAAGGIHDHIGGGFSRYSTDDTWLVPHFEKMLYDNALLALAYMSAYKISKKEYWKSTAQSTLHYILRELAGNGGEFYCGQDADSDGVEGKYYVFTQKEIEQVLGKHTGQAFCKAFHITRGETPCIPNQIGSKRPVIEEMEEEKRKLYQYRLKRTRLHRDEKTVLSWHAWTILAFAKAADLYGSMEFLRTARQARQFVTENMEKEDRRLYRRYCSQEAAFDGQLEDYAAYGLALLALYESTFETEYLCEAVLRGEQILQYFSDETAGGFFSSPKDGETLLFRQKELYDGAVPSGNSAAALLFKRLEAYTASPKWKEEAERQISYLYTSLKEQPVNHCFALLALQAAVYPSEELICVSAGKEPPDSLKQNNAKSLFTGPAVLFKNRENEALLGEAAPFTREYPIPSEGEVYYRCRNGACFLPEKNGEICIEQNKA